MNNFLLKFCTLNLLLFLIFSCNFNTKKQKTDIKNIKDSTDKVKSDSIQLEKHKKIMEELAMMAEEPIFEIKTSLGNITIKLYSKTPQHRENFAKLSLEGFYDNTLFHRVIDNFMIQGGDPFTKSKKPKDIAKYGQGGPGYTIPAEFVPEYKHKKGALAAARRGDIANPKKESSGSQFYIVQNENTCSQLDGDYTVFGETIEGFDIIDKIAKVHTDNRDKPIEEVKILKITLKK